MIRRLAIRFRSASFRAGLATALIVGTIVGLPITAVVVSVSFLSTTNFDAVVAIAESIEEDVPPDELWTDESPADITYLVLLDADGNIVRQRGSAPASVLEDFRNQQSVPANSLDPRNFDGMLLDSSNEWNLASVRSVDSDGLEYLVAAGNPPAASPWYTWLLGIFITLGAAIPAGLIAAWTVRHSLRRVDAIQTEVQQISSRSLDRRLPVQEVADPIDRLPHTMNEMLERLEMAQEQQNRFVADASHELRSPVAGILAQLDVAKQYPDQVDVDDLLPRLHTEASRTQAIVEDLLYLSRLDGVSQVTTKYPSVGEAIDVVEAEVDRHTANGSQAEVQLDRSKLVFDSSDSSLQVSIFEPHLARIVQNLVDNAVRHCRSRVRVELRLDPPRAQGGSLRISVIDDGEGIAPADRERIFSRFVRLDEARSRDSGGSGLGLAITKELVDRVGGTIAVLDSPDPNYPGANFQVTLPVNSPMPIFG